MPNHEDRIRRNYSPQWWLGEEWRKKQAEREQARRWEGYGVALGDAIAARVNELVVQSMGHQDSSPVIPGSGAETLDEPGYGWPV